MIKRYLTQQLMDQLKPGKAVVIYGARQVGKTTLAKYIQKQYPGESKYINCDELIYQEAMSSRSVQALQDLVGNTDLFIIDEAQRVENIGINLKLIIDHIPNTAVLVTGSAALELAGSISEPLTGRKSTFCLYPLSYAEITKEIGKVEASAKLDDLLIYGGYPEAFNAKTQQEKQSYLNEIAGSYLYRDVLALEGIRRADKIVNLLRLIAFQIGGEVSIAELATSLSLNHRTVERYLDLLEKSSVIYRVAGFSRNLRKEITKNARYYFYDNGVRNALIQNFNPLALRNDTGQLWENFVVTERRKVLQYQGVQRNFYFWRTYDQKEIDLIEEGQGRLYGYEIKWRAKKFPAATQREFMRAYEEAELALINRENFEKYLGM